MVNEKIELRPGRRIWSPEDGNGTIVGIDFQGDASVHFDKYEKGWNIKVNMYEAEKFRELWLKKHRKIEVKDET